MDVANLFTPQMDRWILENRNSGRIAGFIPSQRRFREAFVAAFPQATELHHKKVLHDRLLHLLRSRRDRAASNPANSAQGVNSAQTEAQAQPAESPDAEAQSAEAHDLADRSNAELRQELTSVRAELVQARADGLSALVVANTENAALRQELADVRAELAQRTEAWLTARRIIVALTAQMMVFEVVQDDDVQDDDAPFQRGHL